MKTIILTILTGFCLLMIQCTPTTSTTLEKPEKPEKEVAATELEEPVDDELKEALKEEIKEELKSEIMKELAEEKKNTEIKAQTSTPVKPEKPVYNTPQKPEKPTVMDVSTANNIIQGAWDWVGTLKVSRGVGNVGTNPESVGYRKTAVFRKNGTCEILINNHNAGTYSYKITATPEQLMIKFTNPDGASSHMENGPLKLTNNQFTILGNYNDRGSNITYKRL